MAKLSRDTAWIWPQFLFINPYNSLNSALTGQMMATSVNQWHFATHFVNLIM